MILHKDVLSLRVKYSSPKVSYYSFRQKSKYKTGFGRIICCFAEYLISSNSSFVLSGSCFTINLLSENLIFSAYLSGSLFDEINSFDLLSKIDDDAALVKLKFLHKQLHHV